MAYSKCVCVSRMVAQRGNLLTSCLGELLRIEDYFDSLEGENVMYCRHSYVHSFLYTRTHVHSLCFVSMVLFDCYGEVNRKMPDGKYCRFVFKCQCICVRISCIENIRVDGDSTKDEQLWRNEMSS